MRQLYAFLSLLLFACNSYGQNMVMNPSFEQYFQCPNTMSQFLPTHVAHWDWGNLYTPDYFNACGFAGYSVPGNIYGSQQAYSGNAYAGIRAWEMSTNTEYLEGDLFPLVANTFYEVVIHVSLANNSKYAIADFGVFFYQNGVGANTNTYGNIAVTPQIDYTQNVITDTANWITLTDTFYADSAYSKIIIGNFSSHTNTTVVTLPYNTGFVSYYYIDSVIVRPLSTIQAPLAGYLWANPVTCLGYSNGVATAYVMGGIPPYTFLWSNGQITQTATGLAPGSYSCIITDAANSSITLTTTVAQPNSSLSASVQNVTGAPCGQPFGIASVLAVGGWNSYTYQWLPNGGTGATASNLIPGNYMCIVTDAGGCIDTAFASVPAVGVPFAVNTLTLNNVLCYGQSTGMATVSVSGGQQPYSWLWSNGQTSQTATGLSAGTYTVTVTDANGCSHSNTATIVNQFAALTLTSSVVNILCGQTSGSATVTPSGGQFPYAYSWSNGQTTQTAINLAAGTYTCTVTDASGCTASITATVNLQPALVAYPTTVTNVNCYGQNTGSIMLTVSGGTPPYTYWWSNGAQTQNVFGLPAGNYSCSVVDQANCMTTISVTITQPPQLDLSVTSVTNALCGQTTGSASVSASGGTPGYTYSWSPYGGSGTTATNLGAGMYTVTVTDTKGCTDTVHITISTSTPLSVSVSSFSNVSCYGQNTGSASVNVSGGTGPYTYSWSNGGTTSSISNVPAGSYGVTVTDQNGCAGTALISITQPPQLNAIISSTNNISCFGQNTGSAFTAVSGGTPGYTYLWSSGSTASSIFGAAAGTYSVVVTDANGCHDTAYTTITQASALIIAVSSANATCSQNNGWATASPVGGTSPYTYIWSNSQPAPTINNLGAGSYTVNVTDANGCTATATVAITQSASLTLNTTTTSISCQGMDNGAATVSVSTGTPPYTYNWSNGGTTQTITNLPAGTYTVTVTDAINCQGTATVTIAEPTVLGASILSSTNALCNGTATGTAEATASGGTAPYTYLWSNNGTTALQSALSAGSYFVIITDTNGCTDSANVTINEPTVVTISAQATTASCVGEAQGAAAATASGGTPPYSYSWNSNPVQTTHNATNLPAGNYIVTATDDNGCTVTANVTILAHPQAVVDAGDDTTYCHDKDLLVLQATGAATYLWSPATGLSCTACPDPTANPSVSTTYTVSGTDVNGCIATDDVHITVIAKQPTSVGLTKDICTGESTQLFAEGGVEYSWSPSAGMNDSAVFDPTVTPQQTTIYTVTIKQNDCFTDTLTQVVNVHTMPSVSLGPDIKSTTGASVQLHADTINATSIIWTPAFNLDCDNCADPTAFIEKDIRYVATVSNGGCTARDDINIRISCTEADVFLPNSFTPNLDGNNDMFYPQSSVNMVIANMAIYDRWGEKIFQKENFKANDPVAGWDGTYKGRVLEPNVYVYYIHFYCGNGQKFLLKGDISIVK